jgi:glycosyltransferase involved in cell wall biosynthesis
MTMKIGIMITCETPEIGGGFTFEQGIFDALLRLRRETPHELVLVGEAAQGPALLSEFPWICVKTKPLKKAKIRREIRRILNRIVVTRKADAEPLLDFERAPEVLAADLDLIVYLNPFFSPFLDIPYVFNIWDLAHRVLPFFPEINLAHGWKSRERYYQERLQRASYIISPNAAFRQQIVDFYRVPAERIRLLHHPTPADVLRQDANPAKDEPLDSLGVKGDFLFYPAQFWPHKNHLLLLRMLQVLRKKYDYTPQLVLTGSDKPLFDNAGAGNLAYVRNRARKMGLDDQVIFAGFVSREMLMTLYRKATALVFPSFLGPENLPPLEAFALGCPVITSELTGSRDQYGDAALQVDPTSPELWADAVQQLRVDAALRANLITKGKARAAQFTSDDFVRGLFSIFDEFEAYRCNWTSEMSQVPLKSDAPAQSPPL